MYLPKKGRNIPRKDTGIRKLQYFKSILGIFNSNHRILIVFYIVMGHI